MRGWLSLPHRCDAPAEQRGPSVQARRVGVLALTCAVGLLVGCATSPATSASSVEAGDASGRADASTSGTDGPMGGDNRNGGGDADPNPYGDAGTTAPDECPDDPNKVMTGTCGCGVADADTDEDGQLDCQDGCPGDPAKTEPLACGCGLAETDKDGNTVPDCLDTPVLPVTINQLGRTLTATAVRIDGQPATRAEVTVGAAVQLELTGTVVDLKTTCDDCITQFYARMDGVFSLCLGSSTGDFSVQHMVTFKAPSVPGVYFVNPASTWEFSCLQTTTVGSQFGAGTLATLVVR